MMKKIIKIQNEKKLEEIIHTSTQSSTSLVPDFEIHCLDKVLIQLLLILGVYLSTLIEKT